MKEILLCVLGSRPKLLLCHLGLLIPVFCRFGIHENGLVHGGHMLCSVPSDAWRLIFCFQFIFVNIIFSHDLEKWLVSAELKRSKLIIIPVFLIDVFDIGILVSAEYFFVHVGALFTNEGTEPDDGMSSLILFAVNAILVIRISKFFLQVLFQFSWLLKLTRFEEVFLFFKQLFNGLNFFWLFRDWSLNILINRLLNRNMRIWLQVFHCSNMVHIYLIFFLLIIIYVIRNIN